MAKIATADRVDRQQLLDFVRPRHRGTLVTRRKDGGLQMSPVTCGVDGEGRIVVSTYPRRAKAVNARRDPQVSILVHSDEWDGAYVQVDGTAEVIDMPAAVEPLVEYFRCISGEHPDWEEYRDAMRRQNRPAAGGGRRSPTRKRPEGRYRALRPKPRRTHEVVSE